jgi:hypothetical protein
MHLRNAVGCGDFSYRSYLEHQGIYTVIYYPTSVQLLETGQAGKFQQFLEPVRQFAARTIYKIFLNPSPACLKGFCWEMITTCLITSARLTKIQVQLT